MLHYRDDNELVSAAVAGDEQAMSALIKSLMPCVEVQASKFSDLGALTRHDLIQEGLLGAVRAVFGFDSKKSVKFKTYAEACIANSIADAVRNQSRKKHSPLNSYVSIDEVELTGVNPHDPERVVFMAEEMEQIKSCIDNELTDLEYGVLMRHIAGDSYDEIALDLNVSTKSVDNALSRARKKIKSARNV
ncbi:MAG: sigma-70 family RNA polymerase sigma factor [Clostridia bacterium]|nr:sigma-70 family RNA polymerase sigma factor [Clostridia bacterium]